MLDLLIHKSIIMRSNKLFIIIQKYLIGLFLVLTGIYLLWQFSLQTTFYLPVPSFFSKALFGTMTSVVILRICSKGFSLKKTGISIIVAVSFILVYLNDKYSFLLYTAVLIIGLEDIEYQRIIKVYLFTVGLFFLVTVMAGITNSITNYIFVRAERGIRSSWGICYPTDLASTYYYLLLFLWVAWKKLPNWIMLVLSASSIFLSGQIAYSSTGVICSVMFFFAVLFHMLKQYIDDKNPDKFVILKLVDILLIAAFPAFGGGFFALMVCYAKGLNIGFKMDHFLSNRLRLAVDALRNYGLKPFGTPFEQIGAGFSSIIPVDYNFVDSSYPLILIRYGVVLFIVITVLWCWMTRKAIKIGDRRLALIMGLIAFHSISEHHFMEAHYNILLVMPFASYIMPVCKKNEEDEKKTKQIVEAASVTAAVMILVVCVLSPYVLSWVKTIYEIKNLVGGKDHAPWVITWNLLVLTVASGIVCCLYKLLASWFTEKKLSKKALGVLLLCLCIALGEVLYIKNCIRTEIHRRAENLKMERGAINLILKSASGKIYAGTCPVLYKTCFPDISYSVFAGEELARHYGSTVIMDSDTEYQGFLRSGFLYTRISDEHSVYTSDTDVIRALSEAGLHMTSYYSTEKSVNMLYEARLNGLSYSKKKGVLVRGFDRSLRYGPYLDLFGGQYTVTFHLKILEGDYNADSFVAALQIWTGRGKEKLLEKEVWRSDFNENGETSVSIPFSVRGAQGVEFTVIAGQNRKLYVHGIDYKRTPEYDTHFFYDKKMRLVREEYYDTDGNPMAHTGGYYSMDQEYDSFGNVAVRRFYDTDGKLTLRTEGYAEIRLYYDVRRRVIREEFYGTSGEPVMVSGRYAADEREYDDAGNITAQRYFDTNGELIVSTAGYAEIHRNYNDKKKVILEEYFGIDRKPLLQTYGYSAIEQEYDVDGNISRRRFLHEGNPVFRTDGYAEVRWDYNGLHQIIRESFYGADGEPVIMASGYSIDEREYDTAGNVIVNRYYDEQGAPILVSGYSELRRVFDDRRQIHQEEYFDQEGQPVLRSEGYASWKREYTEEGIGIVKSQSYYGVSGEPVIMSEGYHSFRREFDTSGNMISESYFDTEGKPIHCKKGYASLHRSYDASNNISEDVFYNTEGSHAILGVGYTSIRYEYDNNRQLLLTYYLDESGKPVQAGSAYLHEYLQSLKGKDFTIFISAKDEAASALTPPLLQDLKELGIKTDLQGRLRSSYYAVITPAYVIEDIGSQTVLTFEGIVGEKTYKITSAGYQVGNTSSIMIDGIEYSKNRRGLNIVVYDNALKQVTDSVSFDTYVQEMTVTR